MPKQHAPRSQLRRDVSVAVWVFFILGLVFGVPFLIVQLTSDEPGPAPVATPTETVASCAGPKPPTPLRSPGPFTAPDPIDVEHVFVATIKTYCGNLVFKIDPKDAPEAARSFVFLARTRFYAGLTFDRIVPDAGIHAGSANPGYTVAASGPRSAARGDLVMVADGGRVAARFFVASAAASAIDGVRIGSVLEGDPATFAVLARLMAQPASGGVPSPSVPIIHVEIQEFTRE